MQKGEIFVRKPKRNLRPLVFNPPQAGGVIPGSKAVNIPFDDPNKKPFVSLYLQKQDLERGIEMLNQVSENLPPILVESLYVSALTIAFRGFSDTRNLYKLDEEKFKAEYPALASSFDEFKARRERLAFGDGDRVYFGAQAYLWVAPENCTARIGGPPGADVQPDKTDYLAECRKLHPLMQALWCFVLGEIDLVGDKINETYKEMRYINLMMFGERK